MIKIETKLYELLKKLQIISFALIWIYTLSYPYIDNFFNLKSNYKHNTENIVGIMYTSVIPIFNTAALIVAIREDIKLYKQNNKKI